MKPLALFPTRRARASAANERARALEAAGDVAAAVAEYERACSLAPSWSVPFYNLGLLHKYAGDWAQSLACNTTATRLSPGDAAGWWNLGIAATALGRWQVARAAWRGAGLDLPEGEGPVDFPCGLAPIRLNPASQGEVVWADRIDPARAVLRNIPLPDSGFHHGDVVLNDGAPQGYRLREGREVPVFNCLALLDPSPDSTWVVEVAPAGTPRPDAAAPVAVLVACAERLGLAAEAWSSSVRTLCRACSEGRPDAHHEHDVADPGDGVRTVAIAARTREAVDALLEAWRPQSGGASIVDVKLALAAGRG